MSITFKTGNVGSISHGTLRTVDLLESLGDELGWLIQKNGDYLAMPENFPMRDRLNLIRLTAIDYINKFHSGDDDSIPNPEEFEANASEFLNERLFSALEEFSPAYCYFGSNPGDASDFGYWPDMGAIEELEKFEEVPDPLPGDDFAVVNDHGNITVYGADGFELISLV